MQAGSRDVDGGGAVVGRPPAGLDHALVLVVGRHDGDGVRVAARVVGRRVGVAAGVAGGGHEEDVRVVGRGDGVLQGLAEAAAAPRVAHHVDAHHRGVVDAGNGAVRRTGAAAAEELAAHDLDVPVHARHADAVVANATDGAGAVRTVVVVVHGVAVVVVGIHTVDVVDVAVGVVVDAVAGDLAGIRPGIGREVGVRVVDTGVDHGDHDIGRTVEHAPALGRVDVSVRGTDMAAAIGLAGVVHAPEVAEQRIVRHFQRVLHVVGLGVFHVGVRLEGADRGFHRIAADVPVLGADELEFAQLLAGHQDRLLGGRHAGLELHDQFARDPLLRGIHCGRRGRGEQARRRQGQQQER